MGIIFSMLEKITKSCPSDTDLIISPENSENNIATNVNNINNDCLFKGAESSDSEENSEEEHKVIYGSLFEGVEKRMSTLEDGNCPLKNKENQFSSNLRCRSVHAEVVKESKNADESEVNSEALASGVGNKRKEAGTDNFFDASHSDKQNGDQNSIHYSGKDRMKNLKRKEIEEEQGIQLSEDALDETELEDENRPLKNEENQFSSNLKCRSVHAEVVKESKNADESDMNSETLASGVGNKRKEAGTDNCFGAAHSDKQNGDQNFIHYSRKGRIKNLKRKEIEEEKEIQLSEDALDKTACFELGSSNICFQNEIEQHSTKSQFNEIKKIREKKEGSKNTSKTQSQEALNEITSNNKENYQLPVVDESMIESIDNKPDKKFSHNVPKSLHSKCGFQILSTACQTEASPDTSQLSHVSNEELLRHILRNWLLSNSETVKEFAQESKEYRKMKNVAIQSELFTEKRVKTPKNSSILCAENEHLIPMIQTFRLQSQRLVYTLAQISNTISNESTNNEIPADVIKSDNSAINVDSVSLSDRTENCPNSRKIKSENTILTEEHTKVNHISNCKILLEERNAADNKSGQDTLSRPVQRNDSSKQMKIIAPSMTFPLNKLQIQTQEEESTMVTSEKVEYPTNAFSKSKRSEDIMGRNGMSEYRAADNIIIASQTKQIVSRKRNRSRNATQSDKSYTSWRSQKTVSSDSEDSCSDSESYTPDSIKQFNLQKQNATLQWVDDIDEKCITYDVQQQEQDCKFAEVVNNPGEFSAAPDESNLCLSFSNLKLELFNNPSFVNLELNGKRLGNNLIERPVKTATGNRELVLPDSAIVSHQNNNQRATDIVELQEVKENNCSSAVKKGEFCYVQKTPELKVGRKEVLQQSQCNSTFNQSARKESIVQKGMKTISSQRPECERLFSNNQSVTLFQTNETPCLPSTSTKPQFPECSKWAESLGDTKLNPGCENENCPLSINVAIKKNSSGSFTFTGTPDLLNEQHKLRGELANNIEILVDSFQNFTFSDGEHFEARNENGVFSFQNKNLKMTMQPQSNLDNFKLCYEQSSSKSELQFESNDKKLVLEIENN